MNIPSIRLRPRADKRIRSGHPWVFSNEIDGDVRALPEGGTVDVFDASGAHLGRGYANPHSLIAVRILSRRKQDVDHPSFLTDRLRQALRYRRAVFGDRRDLRLVHAEGDGLPGLVIDRFNDVLAVQITTLGMERRREQLRAAIEEVLSPRAVVLRSEGPSRRKEGLQEERALWFGDLPEHIDIHEEGVIYRVNPHEGQKTGHFYDQASNRLFAGPLCRGRRVLDMYANGGGWALQALHHGAASAIAVDKSSGCCDRMEVNAGLNGVSDRLQIVCAEGRRTLQDLVQQGERFGAVVLDPPAFAKNRKAAGSALRGYRDINQLGLSLLEDGGLLFTNSCSYHVQEERFIAEIQAAARATGRVLRVVRRGEQSADHPMRPEVPESRYLKSWAFYVTIGR